MDTIIITLEDGSKKEYKKGIKVKEIINLLNKEDVVYATFNDSYVGYDDVLFKNGNLKLFDIYTKEGIRTYEKGLTFLFKVCALNILGKDTRIKVRHSIDKGVFFEVDRSVTQEEIKEIKDDMKKMVSRNIPFIRIDTSVNEAMEYFHSIKREDKVKTLFYDKSEYVTLYKFDDVYNYIIGPLPYDSSVLKYFDLTLLKDKGIILRFPSIYDNGKILKYTHHEQFFNSIDEYLNWAKILNISNVGELNDAICNGRPGELINLSETIQNYRLQEIASYIKDHEEDIKIVLLSGPSSSGKTTTSRKLSMYLKTFGLNPVSISLDDYFLNRTETPLDEYGKPDFESIRAIDVKLFNNQIGKLLKGHSILAPTFNFITGEKEFNKHIELKKNDILVIEGLHAISDELLTSIPRKNKYKIYISPLAYLSIDDDNRINLTDIRLLRRMVRDNRTRGYSPSHTLNNWASVRNGEEKYIFPYQDAADVVFNTFLAYELSVLKVYALPLLYTVKHDDPEYNTALRLIRLLDLVLPLPSEDVPSLSILREFIGTSYFED